MGIANNNKTNSILNNQLNSNSFVNQYLIKNCNWFDNHDVNKFKTILKWINEYNLK